jgi:hypothetical protein
MDSSRAGSADVLVIQAVDDIVAGSKESIKGVESILAKHGVRDAEELRNSVADICATLEAASSSQYDKCQPRRCADLKM